MRFKCEKTGKGYWNITRTTFRVIVGETSGTIINTLTAQGGEKFSPHDPLKQGEVYHEVAFDNDVKEHYFVPERDMVLI